MADSPLNTVEATVTAREAAPGEVPDAVRRRYLTERQGATELAYFVDARVETPAFRDNGKRLSSDRNDPNVIRDLVAIARHRGWTGIAVRGQTDFRREVWITARRAGLEVRGYRPTERDLQDLARRGPAPDRPQPDVLRSEPLRVVEAVVRNRVVEPAEQSRILAMARERLARWLERAPHVDSAGPARDR